MCFSEEIDEKARSGSSKSVKIVRRIDNISLEHFSLYLVCVISLSHEILLHSFSNISCMFWWHNTSWVMYYCVFNNIFTALSPLLMFFISSFIPRLLITNYITKSPLHSPICFSNTLTFKTRYFICNSSKLMHFGSTIINLYNKRICISELLSLSILILLSHFIFYNLRYKWNCYK